MTSLTKYLIVKTCLGPFGIVYRLDAGKTPVERITLPKTRDLSITTKETYRVRKRHEVVAEIHRTHPAAKKGKDSNMLELANLIKRYTEGEPAKIPLSFVDLEIPSPFQRQVLRTEYLIPRGKTATYSWVARQIGSKAVRSVGTALARNPFPIVIPCHRAIRSDRSIGKYQGGSEMKRELLMMEGVRFDERGRVNEKSILR